MLIYDFMMLLSLLQAAGVNCTMSASLYRLQDVTYNILQDVTYNI